MEVSSSFKKYALFSDAELVAKFQQGEDNAFPALVDRHISYLKTTIAILIKDKDEQQDVLQDLFEKVIKILRRKKGYVETNLFRAWIIRVCHNVCIDRLRQQQLRPTSSYDDNPKLVTAKGDDQYNLEEKAIKSEEHIKLRQCIQLLPFDQRQIVIMRCYLGMSYKEIIARLGLNRNTAIGRMRYSKLKLAEMMQAS